MDRYEQIRALIAVVDSGSFSAAAEQLGQAKSMVSRRVSALEKRLGARLIQRTTRRLRLTDAGQAFHERARQLLMDLEEAENLVRSDQCALSGRLRITAPLSFGQTHMGPVIADFCRRHPQVQLDAAFNDHQMDLIEAGFDIALRIGVLSDSSLIAKRINTIRIVTVAAPAYLEQHGAPVTPLDLERHRGLHYSLNGADAWRYCDADDRLLQPRVPVRYMANNGDHLRDMAIAGLGVAVLPRFIVYQALRRGDLVALLEEYRLPEAGMYLVFPPGRFQSHRVRVFGEFLTERFSGDVPWEDERAIVSGLPARSPVT